MYAVNIYFSNWLMKKLALYWLMKIDRQDLARQEIRIGIENSSRWSQEDTM